MALRNSHAKMSVGWVWFPPLEIWVKCPECGAWKSIDPSMEKRDLRKEPYETRCPRPECGHPIIIDRKWFWRKNMKKPKREG